MRRNATVQKLVIAALLCAIGILIPMISPFKILLEPASFTLASHVAIFIAMFISPWVAAAVAIGTTIGFSFSFPLVVVLRSASHIVFAVGGAMLLKSKPAILQKKASVLLYSFLIAVLHAAAEVAVVVPFYFGNRLSAMNYDKGFLISVVLLVGVGTVVHSMVDFFIALLIWKPLSKTMRFDTHNEG